MIEREEIFRLAGRCAEDCCADSEFSIVVNRLIAERDEAFSRARLEGNLVDDLKARLDRCLKESDAWRESTIAARRDRDETVKCLMGLVKVHEEWNDSVSKIIGRDPKIWSDTYLDQARDIIAQRIARLLNV